MKIDQSQFSPSLDHPSLEGLAYILRHKELWPKNFHWEFRDCDKCAMGLAAELWREIRPNYFDMAVNFIMDLSSAYNIFIAEEDGSLITPETIALRIEKYLSLREKPVDSSPNFAYNTLTQSCV